MDVYKDLLFYGGALFAVAYLGIAVAYWVRWVYDRYRRND
jgi:hypothetical protein